MGLSLAALLGTAGPVTLVVRDADRAVLLAASGVSCTGLLHGRARPHIVRSVHELPTQPPPDVIFVATKTTALGGVIEELRPYLARLGSQPADGHGGPYIVSFQNGIETGRDLMQGLAYPRVLRMVLNYGASQDSASSARVGMNTPPHFVGGPDRRHAAFETRLAELLTGCGLRTCSVEDIERPVWTKGIINAAMNPVAALTDSTVGQVLDSPARSIVGRLAEEGVVVAKAAGIALDEDVLADVWSTFESARAHTPSMVADIRQGRESEVGQLNRQIVAHGHRMGIPTPCHEVVASLIDAFDWRVFERRDRDFHPHTPIREVEHALRT